jgi:hypothetical protein
VLYSYDHNRGGKSDNAYIGHLHTYIKIFEYLLLLISKPHGMTLLFHKTSHLLFCYRHISLYIQYLIFYSSYIVLGLRYLMSIRYDVLYVYISLYIIRSFIASVLLKRTGNEDNTFGLDALLDYSIRFIEHM